MNPVKHLLINFALTLPIALFVWLHYRNCSLHSSHRFSTFWPRFWTGPIDNLVLWPITYVSTIVPTMGIPTSLAALLIFLDTIAWALYSILMHGAYGQTVGKMATKVKVLDFRTEGKITYRQAFLRDCVPLALGIILLGYLMYILGLESFVDSSAIPTDEAMAVSKPLWVLMSLPLLWFAAEVVTMLSNKKRRALHDYIAGTIVVRLNINDVVNTDNVPVKKRRSMPINYRKIRTPY